MEAELLASGIADRNRGFNLTWHDWLNLRSQIEVSKVIALAAMQRENSRGAHYRDDFKEPGDLETSTYTIVREKAGKLQCHQRAGSVHDRQARRDAAEGSRSGGVARPFAPRHPRFRVGTIANEKPWRTP